MSIARISASLSLILLLLGLAAPSAHAEQEERGLVLESHVGSRPRDASYLLAFLVEELKSAGFRDSSVAATRIQSLHSISSQELTNKQIEIARRAIADGQAAYADFRFEGAIDAAGRGLDILMQHPATMARRQPVRTYAYKALITISMAHNRLGNTQALDETMTEFIRSFPDREVSQKSYGPEGEKLYRRINKALSTQKKGEFQIAAGPESMVFVNERYVGLGSQTLDLFPGRYRVYTQNGSNAGRVHLVEIEGEGKHTLLVDDVMDRALRTNDKMVGFVFADEAERQQHEKRVTNNLGKALGTDTIILIGLHTEKGRDSVVAKSFSISTGELGPSARVPLPASGAPSATQLRALANFVAGTGPPSPEIEVLSARKLAARVDSEPTPEIRKSPAKASGGLSSAWRWGSWGLGAASIGAGAYLLAIDGTGSCNLQPGQVACPENYDTLAPGIGLVASGTALGLLGFYLWTREAPEAAAGTALQLMPTRGGARASLSGTF